jgi:hypothetical protein
MALSEQTINTCLPVGLIGQLLPGEIGRLWLLMSYAQNVGTDGVIQGVQ